jgi:hypothetical protein
MKLSRWPDDLERYYLLSNERQRGRARVWLAAEGYRPIAAALTGRLPLLDIRHHIVGVPGRAGWVRRIVAPIRRYRGRSGLCTVVTRRGYLW